MEYLQPLVTSTYRPRLVAHPHRWLLPASFKELTMEALRASVTDVALHEVTAPLGQRYPIEFRMRRDSHASALDELGRYLAEFGFTFADAFISQWVRQTIQGAATGLVAAGGGTAWKTRNPNATTAAAGIGFVVGGIAGSLVHQEIARFVAQRDPWSGLWQVNAVALPETAAFRFGFA
jgi:hypothetical protein